MKKHSHNKVVFKPYVMGKPSLLPADLNELVPKNHLVKTVNETIEQLDLVVLEKQYKGGGTSSYHPMMMLKVLVYAYVDGLYSSRKIAKALRGNVNFMWLSGQSRPDFRTINRFRGVVMKEVIGEVFASVVELLIEQGHVKMENYFLDGTKIEANANRYSYVWAKNTQRYKKQVREKIGKLLEEIEQVNQAEQEQYGDQDLPEMGEEADVDAERLKEKLEQLNERLRQGRLDDKAVKKAVRVLEKDCLPRLKKYEEQEETLNGRNSYSKTDPEATFMLMKEDHSLPEARPKAAYNVQLGTEDQFVVGFSVHQTGSDTPCMIPHLEEVYTHLGRLPENIVGDAGFGSEENYMYLENQQRGIYVKYRTFDKERKAQFRDNPFRIENFAYDPERNAFTCQDNRILVHAGTKDRLTQSGFVTHFDRYECLDCSSCPVKSKCTRAAGNRQFSVSWNAWRLRDLARQNLRSEKGHK